MGERKYFLEGRNVHIRKENIRCVILGYKNRVLLHFSQKGFTFAHPEEAVKALLWRSPFKLPLCDYTQVLGADGPVHQPAFPESIVTVLHPPCSQNPLGQQEHQLSPLMTFYARCWSLKPVGHSRRGAQRLPCPRFKSDGADPSRVSQVTPWGDFSIQHFPVGHTEIDNFPWLFPAYCNLASLDSTRTAHLSSS